MMNKKTMTKRFAIAYLEGEYESIYRGVKTVDEMCSTLVDRIYWENEDGDKLYHQFETKSGPNKIVADDCIINVAQFYWGQCA